MHLDRARKLLSGGFESNDPRTMLAEVLAASIELVSQEDNDFCWSSWVDAATAVAELQSHLDSLAQPGQPDTKRMSVLFAPTGPMQELSLSSGWGEPFVQLASYFDSAEEALLR